MTALQAGGPDAWPCPRPPAGGARRTCLIGAGPAGIAVARALQAAGLPFDWIERGDAPGGLWQQSGREPHSPMYRGLRMNTTSQAASFADRRLRSSTAFPTRAEVHTYLDDYVEHHRLLARLRTATRCLHVQRTVEGRFLVTTDRDGDQLYDAVVVATGRQSLPVIPEDAVPVAFSGRVRHVCELSDLDDTRGRHVVIVGLGHTGADFAVEACRRAASTTVVIRRPPSLLPKTILGCPFDQVPLLHALPPRPRLRAIEALLHLARGSQTRYGLPDVRPFWQAPLVFSDELPVRLADGQIRIRGEIASASGRTLRFADGQTAVADDVLLATGYRPDHGFLAPDLAEALAGDAASWFRTFTSVPGLMSTDRIHAAGAFFPVYEAQGALIAAAVAGRYVVPGRAAVRAWAGARPSGGMAVWRPDVPVVMEPGFGRAVRRELRTCAAATAASAFAGYAPAQDSAARTPDRAASSRP